jgi:hypothetical protein
LKQQLGHLCRLIRQDGGITTIRRQVVKWRLESPPGTDFDDGR